MNALLLDRSETDRTDLKQAISNCPGLPRNYMFYEYEQKEVFKTDFPKDISAVFITIINMADVEAAKQFVHIHGSVPLVVVSDSGEYSIEAYRFGARYYIERPITQGEICEALRHCAM